MILVKIIIMMLLLNILNAQNLTDIIKTYMSGGKSEVVQDLESILIDVDFWKEYIKDIDIKYGYFGYKEYLILASKKKKSILVYKIKEKNPIIYKKIPALFGAINGDKQYEGDKKTPIGIYDFIARLNRGNKNLAEKFGPLAFVTTYPNLMDKLIYKKTGHGIWLHGKPKNSETKMDTLGCVAIDNNELSNLGDMIDYKKAILIISQDKYAKSSKKEIALLLANLYMWRHSWIVNDFTNYISFYDDNFRRYDNKSLNQFSKFKKKIFKKNRVKEILFSKINIIPYIQSDGRKMFKISFYEKYKSQYYKFNGQKNLYVELIDEKMNIIMEE
jgi:murein L,D-transpeptidase YafK